MFQREISNILGDSVKSFPATALTGPRQSGKTTLLKTQFPNHHYISLEDPDTLLLIKEDPRGMLENLSKHGIIIDEAQNYPELFSYIQGYIDQLKQPGQFILSGSQNFLLSQHISQSLAGRVAVLELLPLTYQEYLTNKDIEKTSTLWHWLYNGTYPRPYQEKLPIKIWYNSYIKTYLERDVRTLINVKDLNAFQRFIRLCAGRHGQLLNLNQLAQDADISPPTAKQWLSVLEASYLIFLLQPHHKNFNKRLIKMPKLYFFDPGLVCQLLGIESEEHLLLHSARGAIFEGYIISEIFKYFYNQGVTPPVYFWRDHRGLEVDCLIERGEKLIALEIKSNSTFRPDMLKSLLHWSKISGVPHKNCQLIYAGDNILKLHDIVITPWQRVIKMSVI